MGSRTIERGILAAGAGLAFLLSFFWGFTGREFALAMFPMIALTVTAAFYTASKTNAANRRMAYLGATVIAVAVTLISLVSTRIGVRSWANKQRTELARYRSVVDAVQVPALNYKEVDRSADYPDLRVRVFASRTETAQMVVRFADGRRGVMYVSRDDLADAGKPDPVHFQKVFRLEKLEPRWYTYIVK
jgi:hypothetical protein